MRTFFEENLSVLMNSLIIPNVKVTSEEHNNILLTILYIYIFYSIERDEILFVEEPQSFIDVFFDNSEINSRKSATIELMKNLSRHYTKPMLDIYQGYLYDEFK